MGRGVGGCGGEIERSASFGAEQGVGILLCHDSCEKEKEGESSMFSIMGVRADGRGKAPLKLWMDCRCVKSPRLLFLLERIVKLGYSMIDYDRLLSKTHKAKLTVMRMGQSRLSRHNDSIRHNQRAAGRRSFHINKPPEPPSHLTAFAGAAALAVHLLRFSVFCDKVGAFLG